MMRKITGTIIRMTSSIQNTVQPSPDRRFRWLEKTGRMKTNKKKNREAMLHKNCFVPHFSNRYASVAATTAFENK